MSGVPFPERIVWVSSPAVGAVAAAVADAYLSRFLGDAPKPDPAKQFQIGPVTPQVVQAGAFPMWDHCDQIAKDACTRRLSPALALAAQQAAALAMGPDIAARALALKERSPKLEWNPWVGGQFWSNYAGWYETVVMIEPGFRSEAGDAYMNLARSSCYAWPNADFVMMCERPSVFSVDPLDPRRLHSTTGPAIGFRDGWGLWRYQGIAVPEHAIMRPQEITVDEISKEDNADVRHALIDLMGMTRYMEEAKLEVLHADSVPVDLLAPRSFHITRILVVDGQGDKYMIACDGSTNHVHHMRVDAEAETCEQAFQLMLPPGCPSKVIYQS